MKPAQNQNIFSIMFEDEFMDITRKDFGSVFDFDVAAFDHVFKKGKAMWLHSGNDEHPHAILTTGKHSNGFVDTLRILKYTNLCEIFAEQMVDIYKNYARENNLPERPDWVIGSDHAGAAFSHAVATKLGSQHDFTEKQIVVDAQGNKIGDAQEWKRFTILPDETVLQVEELITTTTTLQKVRTGILKGNSCPVKFLPLSLTLIHRSSAYTFGDAPILYLRHYDIEVWDNAGSCPLCNKGSEAIESPKKNWEMLTNVE